eukprot:m.424063 g.424063  ORF g.424063 m.424063 type:complete len:210 (+) comp21337_c0_seq1:213-842(+)
MEWLFGRKKTPAEMLREHQRALKKAMRELDREKGALEKQETKLKADIKKSAQAGQMEVTKIQAKDLVRTRKHVRKMIMMRTQIQAVSLKIQTLKSTETMAQAMKGVAKAMGRMNKSMNLPQLMQIMREFERQSEIMDMKSETMDDAIDEAMGDEEDEEETEEIVQQVMEELGLSMGADMVNAPHTAVKDDVTNQDDLLQKRLDNLKNDQ